MLGTGLLDKNGKQIYEGDIVKHKMPSCWGGNGEISVTHIGAVEYDEETVSFRTCNEWIGAEPIHDDVEMEVIGNIFENPELIKEIEESEKEVCKY